MKPSQPYRAPLSVPHRAPAPIDPIWRKYRRVARLYNVILGALLLGFVGMAFENPVALPGLFLLIVHVLFGMHAFVRRYRCPRCSQRIIDGRRAPSTWAQAFGVFPLECSHCEASAEPAACECSRCRATASASASS